MSLDIGDFLNKVTLVESPIWSPFKKSLHRNDTKFQQYIESEDLDSGLDNKTQFTISLTDLNVYVHPFSSFLELRLRIVQASGEFQGQPFDADVNVAFVNSIMSVFQRIQLSIDGRLIQVIEMPGIVQTVISLLKWTKSYERTNGILQGLAHDSPFEPNGNTQADIATNRGYKSRQNLHDAGKQFSYFIPMSEIFTFWAQGMNTVIRGSRIQVVLTKENNLNLVFHRALGNVDAKVLFNKVSIWYNTMAPSAVISNRLEKTLQVDRQGMKQKLMFWSDLVYQKSTPFNSGATIADFTFSINTGRPTWIVVFFSLDSDSDTQIDNSMSWGLNVSPSQLDVLMNSTIYPSESLQMDFNSVDTNNFSRAYIYWLLGNEDAFDVSGGGTMLSPSLWASQYRLFYIPLVQTDNVSNRRQDFHLKVRSRFNPSPTSAFSINIITASRSMARLEALNSKFNVIPM